jgi:hypothetical protein
LGRSAEAEHAWQMKHLPTSVRKLVISALQGERFKRVMKKLMPQARFRPPRR